MIGVFGKFQFAFSFWIGLSGLMLALSVLGTKFLTYEVDFWCRRPAHLANMSIDNWLNISAPYIANGASPKFDRCVHSKKIIFKGQ